MTGKGMLHRLWYVFLRVLARILFISFFRIRVFNRRFVPARGGVILAANHQSFLDPVLVGLGLDREVHYMARKELFAVPLFNRLIRSLNAFPVRRGSADRRALGTAVEILRSGGAVLVFPEGTRTRDGSVGKMKPGVVLMARMAGCPIVPVAITGANLAWPRGAVLPKPARIKVEFGMPVSVDRGDPREIIGEIEQTIRKMVGDGV